MSKSTIAEERKSMKKQLFQKIRKFLMDKNKKVFKTKKYIALLTSQSRVKYASFKKESVKLIYNLFHDNKNLDVHAENGTIIKINKQDIPLDPDIFDEYRKVMYDDEEYTKSEKASKQRQA